MSVATTFGAARIADRPVTAEAQFDRIDQSLDALLSSHSNATRATYAVEGTIWYDTDLDQWFGHDGTSDFQIAVNVGTPASAAATGTAGDVAWDADYIYVCTATDTWKRVAVATW